jgi:hypothetical protein
MLTIIFLWVLGYGICKLSNIDFEMPDTIDDIFFEKKHRQNNSSTHVATVSKNITCEAKNNKSTIFCFYTIF